MKYYTSMFHLSKQVKQEHVAESQLVTNIDVYKQYTLFLIQQNCYLLYLIQQNSDNFHI